MQGVHEFVMSQVPDGGVPPTGRGPRMRGVAWDQYQLGQGTPGPRLDLAIGPRHEILMAILHLATGSGDDTAEVTVDDLLKAVGKKSKAKRPAAKDWNWLDGHLRKLQDDGLVTWVKKGTYACDTLKVTAAFFRDLAVEALLRSHPRNLHLPVVGPNLIDPHVIIRCSPSQRDLPQPLNGLIWNAYKHLEEKVRNLPEGSLPGGFDLDVVFRFAIRPAGELEKSHPFFPRTEMRKGEASNEMASRALDKDPTVL